MFAFLGELTNTAFAWAAAGIGGGLVTLGAGIGIGKLAANAMEGIARQPEAGGKIQTAMIISAALIEGVALLCAVICLMLMLKA